MPNSIDFYKGIFLHVIPVGIIVPCSHYIQDCHRGIDDWDITLFEKWEMHKQLKERETFWKHKLKTFYPLGLNEREEYLF